MSINILSPLTKSDLASAKLLGQMNGAASVQMDQKAANISSAYGTKINSINQDSKKWQAVEDETDAAISNLSSVIGMAKSIMSSLDGMIRTVNQAATSTAGDVNYKGYAETFDSLLKGLIGNAENPGAELNLLGKHKSSFEFNIGIHSEKQTVNGSYLGSDYYITDSTGKMWAPDRAAGLLMRYDNYPDDPLNSDSANFRDGLRVDSISGDNVSFTVNPDSGAPKSYSGTITRSGLEVLDSALYEGLATSAGRERALADINAAKEAVRMEIGRYEAAKTMATFYRDRATGEISGQTDKTNTLLVQRAIELNNAQKAMEAEFKNAQSKVARAMALKNNYTGMFAPFITSKLGRSLLDILS